ncbi:Spo77 [Kluyveromyces lactis]|nr:Spo77 [Kluyveromyces lactis]
MSLSVRSQSQDNKVLSDLSEKKSFFKPFQQDKDLDDNLISFDHEREFVQDPTIGSSIKLDGSDVIKFSVRVDESFRLIYDKNNSALKNGSNTQNKSEEADSENIHIIEGEFYWKKLNKLLKEDILHVFEPRTSHFIDVINCLGDVPDLSDTESSNGFLVNEEDIVDKHREYNIENSLTDLGEVILQLDMLLGIFQKVKDLDIEMDVLEKSIDLVARFVNASPDNTLSVLLKKAKEEIDNSECKFVEGRGNCLASILVLQTVSQVPQQLLKSLFFEVQGENLSLLELKHLKVSYSFLLVYHMNMTLLRKIFETCLSMGCSSRNVLPCLEGFIWNAIEMDKSDLIMRMEDTFWKWNQNDKFIGQEKVQSWCIELTTKMETQFNKDADQCNDEDALMNIKDKYNLAKLFINEFNDMLFSTRCVNMNTLATREYTDILTRFANSLETRMSGLFQKDLYSLQRSISFLLTESECESSVKSLNATLIVDAISKPSMDPSSIVANPGTIEERVSTSFSTGEAQEVETDQNQVLVPTEENATQRAIIECDTMRYDGSVYFQPKPIGWLEYLTTMPDNGYRYKLWLKIQKWKKAYLHWSTKRSASNTMRLFETEVANQIRNGLRFHEEYQNTTYGDMDPPAQPRFSKLKEKKRKLMFKFFGDDDE